MRISMQGFHAGSSWGADARSETSLTCDDETGQSSQPDVRNPGSAIPTTVVTSRFTKAGKGEIPTVAIAAQQCIIAVFVPAHN